MTCKDVIEVLADYLDEALGDDVLAEVERHLDLCAPCRAYLATYRKTRRVSADAARVEMPEEMRERLGRFLREHLRAS